jgi:xanthine dehydrogenase small subunit
MRGLLFAIDAARAASVDDLLAHLAGPHADGPPELIAGGTDVMVRLEAGVPARARYVDVSGLADELGRIELDAEGLTIGALATYWQLRSRADVVAAYPLLAAAAATVGAVQIQGRGTWGGNIANGSPAADGVAALLAYDADVVLRSRAGRRTAPLHGFFTGYKTMDLRPGEFIEAVRLPRADGDRRAAFHKVGTRRAQAITKIGLTLRQRGDGAWRVVGTSLAPFVTRYPDIEAVLDAAGGAAPDAALLNAAVAAAVKPIDDLRSTAHYRRAVFGRLLASEAAAR